ncbi:MAG: DUF262 domain-containing HNH endonuclease family protein [Chloroflexi bacterium]|nr:DUF262 domain-containing HNH endonuclease family protein [Chloroflexota bacterium]
MAVTTREPSKRIDVDVLNPKELFSRQIHYQIPRFQRRYIWSQEKHWQPLWDDVRLIAEQIVGDGDVPNPHFLGAVVLQNVHTGVSQTQTRLVVDGQQRLTTLQLLIHAVHKSSSGCGYVPEKPLSEFVWNEPNPTDENAEHIYKVWPTVIDQPSYEHALTDRESNDLNAPILLAHEFFRDETEKWLDAEADDQISRAEALYRVLTQLLHLVVIDLTPTDNPHVIFESLNARGEALLESDLIKNMVMYEAERTGVVKGTQNADWLWDFNDRWWATEVGRGRLRQPRIDALLHQWLIMRTARRVMNYDVFLTFRRYYTDEPKSPIQKVAMDIKDVGDIFRSIETESLAGDYPLVENLKLFLYRRKVLQNSVVIPVLLWLFSSIVPEEQLIKSIRALESHMVRRMIMLSGTIAHNNTFVELIAELHETDPDRAGDTIVQFLRDKDSNVAVWPTDTEIEDAILNNDFYRVLTRNRLRMLLEGIEQGLRTSLAENQEVPRNLTIEHVMPQAWQDNYPLPPDVNEDDRNQKIHTIGNLTLVNRPLNSTMSNAPWIGKREEMKKHSTLFLNKELVDDEERFAWHEGVIAQRAERLCEAAIKVWPYADQL